MHEVTAASARVPYRAVPGLPREDGAGLGLGEGEVLDVGVVEEAGQRAQVGRLRVHVVHVRRELRHQLLLLCLRHAAEADG